MSSIREHFLSKLLAFVAGLAFLNLSFLLAEVSLFKIEERELIENIAKLILNTGFEEEREGESSGENSVKEIIAMHEANIHGISSHLISTRINGVVVDHYRPANHSLTFSPPPDFQYLS